MGNCESQSILQYAHVPVLGKMGPVSELRIINSVWLRDYQGLFDYDSKQVRRSIISVKDSCTLLTDGDKKVTKQLTSDDKKENAMKFALFDVVKRPNYFKVLPINIENEQYTIQKLLWMVIRTVPQQKYPLREKDVLKFGKLKIKVRETVLYENNSSGVPEQLQIKTSKKVYEDMKMKEAQVSSPNALDVPNNDVISIVTENEPICRICLEPGENHNPLICPCKCTGSVKFIHLLCLRTWLGKQLNVSKTKHCISIKWTPLTCQMCKTHYKYRIYLDNKKYYTVQIPKPAKPYVVLEVMKKSAEYSKIYHFISMAETSKLSIGRKKDIDIKLSEDISVSRHHANLIYDFEQKRFLVEDNKSKFGTLVLVKKNMLSNPFQRGLSFQMGGQLFTFQCIRGEGSIPDYKDEEGYLNVIEKGEKRAEEEQSEENGEEDDDLDGQEEQLPQVPSHPTNVNINNHSGVSNRTNVNVVLQPLQEVQPEVVDLALEPHPGHQEHLEQAQQAPEVVQPQPQPLEPQPQQLEPQAAEVEQAQGQQPQEVAVREQVPQQQVVQVQNLDD